MFINPRTAISEGWITGLTDPEKQVQPNAIDFTADRAWEISQADFYVSESHKEMRGSEPAKTYPISHYNVGREEKVDHKVWIIKGGKMLDFLSNVYVDLPEGIAAQLVIRSTLARNGLMLVSGLYDSGFKGHIGFLLHNQHQRAAFIAEGTRVGQIIFVRSDSAGVYSGGYNHEVGTELEYQQ